MNTIQVNLEFKASTEHAKQSIAQLEQQIRQAANVGMNAPMGMTPQIREAVSAAENLHMVLQKTVNTNTGKLNLNKFQAEMKRSGMTLQDLSAKMKALGPAGVQAFSQLATQINAANTSMFSLSASVKPLVNTLFSAARYSIAYGAINAFTKSISSAVDYAHELDEALTDIQVVTGYSRNYMADFTKQANKAAKALSTTTTEYAKASLIYFQQGLTGKDVLDRANTTIKLANVLGESAETVSDWMTAIWNNFDDGSQSLEYYADVLAKLGAATASSADEIAGGLEKFAGVAQTIGLSYEYAASMLTTITAATRQSEEVVGTALKTILSRIEGLNLGETLEDGTTLNKYSESLLKIGVNIKDQNGQLKDMDVILNDIGSRWSLLNRDQQVALAQNVAGVRQYNQFVTLMDNWNTGMLKNVELAKESEGTLNKQYQTYEESLAASKKRVAEALNLTKASLLGTEDMSKAYNFLEKFITVINDLLDAFGGLPTIILMVTTALTKMYQPQISSFFASMTTSIVNVGKGFKSMFTQGSFAPFAEYQKQAGDLAMSMLQETTYGPEKGVGASLDPQKLEISNLLTQNAEKMNEYDRKRYEMEVAALDTATQMLKTKEAELQTQQEIIDESLKAGQRTQDVSQGQGKIDAHGGILSDTIQGVKDLGAEKDLTADSRTSTANTMKSQIDSMMEAAKGAGFTIDENLEQAFKEAEEAVKIFGEKGTASIGSVEEKVQALLEKLNQVGDAALNEAIDKDLGATVSPKEEFKKETHQMGGSIKNANTLNNNMQNIVSSETYQALPEIDQKTLKSYENASKALAKQRKGLLDTQKALQSRKKALLNDTKTMDKNSKQYKNAQKQLAAVDKRL